MAKRYPVTLRRGEDGTCTAAWEDAADCTVVRDDPPAAIEAIRRAILGRLRIAHPELGDGDVDVVVRFLRPYVKSGAAFSFRSNCRFCAGCRESSDLL